MKYVDYKVLLIACLGITLGWPAVALFKDFFTTSVEAVIPWGLAGMFFIFFSTRDVKRSLMLGATYGLFLVLSFCLANLALKYTSAPVASFLFLAVAALVGIVCGVICGLLSLALHALTKFRPS